MVNRALATFQSRGLDTLLGINTFIKQQPGIIDAFAIDGSSLLMVRDDGLGGKIDTYIRGQIIMATTQQSTNSSTGMIQLLKVPYYSVVSVIGNATYVDGVDYNIVTSTGAYQHSTKEITNLVWTSTGAVTGEQITINYNYEKLSNDMQLLMTQPENHVTNRDILFFQTIQVTINITMDIYISGDPTTISNAITTAMSNYINNLPLGSTIEKIEVMTLIKDTTGVNNLDTNTFVFLPSGGGTVDAFDDIVLSAKEYAVAASPTINILT